MALNLTKPPYLLKINDNQTDIMTRNNKLRDNMSEEIFTTDGKLTCISSLHLVGQLCLTYHNKIL